ncbi:MAG: flagellar hook-associated protein FlgK [Planctomycetes bacterium]|nr:flagellar hook-associated protein FlgK [Planctomycetota bacterium]
MGLLNSALHIGRSALLSYQGALQIVGNNVSSAGSADYTRLAPDLAAMQGSLTTDNLQPGAGVALSGIQRYMDEALEDRVRLAIGANASADAQQAATARIEPLFDSISGTDVATRLTEFFNSFDELQNTPDDVATRELALAAGARLSESLVILRDQLTAVGADFDGQIADLVNTADGLAQQIGELNAEITAAEAGNRGQATGLRDQRDALLRDLSDIFDVTVREQPNGALNVYIGSEALVQGGFVRGLTAVEELDNGVPRTTARFADTNQQVEVEGGRLAGLIQARDHYAYGEIGSLDQLASAIIETVNSIHANGQGLNGFASLTGANDLLAADVSLASSASGLGSPVQSGSFFVTVVDDATGTPVAYRIDVEADGGDDDTTLESLAADINEQVDGITASVTSDNRIMLAADAGQRFVFGFDGQQARADTSHVLAALGLNTFFTGSDARDMAVNDELVNDPLLVAASTVMYAGEGSNAGQIAALDMVSIEALEGMTMPAFYAALANSVAITAAAANEGRETTSAVLSALQTQKESISGVNLDEEAISLLKYQRAYQGAARFVSVVNDLLDELVLLVR